MQRRVLDSLVSGVSCSNPRRDYGAADITAVYCLRLHADNPWTLDRLRLAAEHYAPQPRVLVCDFGSEFPYCEQVADLCQCCGFDYMQVADGGVYSAAIAHNRAFERVTTDLLFFSDIDTFGHPTLFADLAVLASDLGMKQRVDTTLVLPVVHLSESDAADLLAVGQRGGRSALMNRFTLSYLYRDASQTNNALMVPYSNIYLMRRDLFSLVGGYDERFRGHGSEDFEFFVRLAHYCKHLPLPRDWRRDCYGPLKNDFYGHKEYVGFRRLLEAMAYPAEMLGLRTFHLWHQRDEKGWTTDNDWKRQRLGEAFNAYARDESALLGIDFLKRPKRALCICKNADEWGYFLPLRLAGFEIVSVADDKSETIQRATEMIAEGAVDALAIFNPYMKSHALFKPLFLLARERGLKTIVVERGALPFTIYYAQDVSYTSQEFSEEAFAAEDFTQDELDVADRYVATLRTGNTTLEKQDSYEETAAKYASLKLLNQPICFIPTQLDDDMAVTHFIKGEQSYAEFVESLPTVIEANPDILFVVKPHPLSKLADMPGKANLIVAGRADNFHFMIDSARWVVCYNSGVGLIGLLHGKPVITIGNAFYNYRGTGQRAASLENAIDCARAEPDPPTPAMVTRLAAWFTQRKYTTFVASDRIREFATRKAHGYKDIMITHFRWNGMSIPLGRQLQDMPLSKRSYLWARIGMSPTKRGTMAPAPKWGASKRGIALVGRAALGPLLSKEDRRRMRDNPIDFFKKAKWGPNRFFGRILLDKSQRPY